MKKTFVIALAAIMCLGSLSASAKKDKKKKVAEEPVPTVLASSNDTLSYAAGMAQTNGLMPYLTGQLKVDTAYMADFIKGFKEAMAKTDDPSYTAHSAGLQIADMVKNRMFPGMQSELEGMPDSLLQDKFVEGFVAALENDTTYYTQESSQEFFQNRMKEIRDAKQEKMYGPNRDAGKKFLEENAKNDSVVVLPSGLQYKVLVKGDGAVPSAKDEVSVKYEGTLIDGTVFDSSYKRKDQVTKFKANQVIKGWTEALTMMPVGSTWMLYIPQELAYGERNTGKIQPYSALIFKVELIGITGKEPAKAEESVKEEPAKKVVAKKAAAKKVATKK